MIRLLGFAALVVAMPAAAQTTLDITVPPGNVVCSYITGPVTSGTTAGHLQATATSSSGAGCGSGGVGNVSFGPATPLTATPTSVSGSSGLTTLSFQALNATTCVGTIAGAAAGTFTGGSTTLCGPTGTSCSGPVSKTASFINTGVSSVNDTVTVQCTGPSGQAQSSAVVTVLGTGTPPASCSRVIAGAAGTPVPSFVQQSGTPLIVYNGDNHTGRPDITSFNSVFGPFPGTVSGQIATDSLPVNNYVSLQFKLPDGYASGAPDGFYYDFSQGTTNYSAPASFSISTSCGDFSDPNASGSTVVKNCRKIGLIAQGKLPWFTDADPNTHCVLQEGVTYFWNIINANVQQVTPAGGTAASYRDSTGSKCTQTSCSVPIYNGPHADYVYP